MTNLILLLQKTVGMGGWMTWVSALALIGLGVWTIYEDPDNKEIGMGLILWGTTAIGLGRKNEKIITDVKDMNRIVNSTAYNVEGVRVAVKGVGDTVDKVKADVKEVSKSQDKVEMDAESKEMG